MPNTLQQVSDAFDRVIADGFMFYASYYSKEWHVSLDKRTYGSTEVNVKGSGPTIFAAVEAAINNFPVNPLDGSKWKTTQLAPPQAEDATFTETES